MFSKRSASKFTATSSIPIAKPPNKSEIKKKIGDSKKIVNKTKKQNKALNKSLASKKKALAELEKTKYKKSNSGVDEAADFLKNYKKKK